MMRLVLQKEGVRFVVTLKVNATLLFFEDGFGRGVAFSLTKRCV